MNGSEPSGCCTSAKTLDMAKKTQMAKLRRTAITVTAVREGLFMCEIVAMRMALRYEFESGSSVSDLSPQANGSLEIASLPLDKVVLGLWDRRSSLNQVMKHALGYLLYAVVELLYMPANPNDYIDTAAKQAAVGISDIYPHRRKHSVRQAGLLRE